MLPLDNVVVLDLSRILTGPYCTMMLADFGAEVIKIEPPAGDDTRHWGPPFVEGESAYFLSVNRNKQSLVLDFKNEQDRQWFREMVKQADVVVENYRPGTLAKWELDYPHLADINPRIILASISGFGATGPGRSRPGYDVVAQAMSGLMSVTGDGQRPTKAGFSVADIGAGMWAAFGIMTALWARERTGRGQWVDTSLYEALVSWQTYQAGNYFATGVLPKALGSAHPNIAPYQAVRARDGYFILACGNDQQWRRFVEIAEVPFGNDEKFATNPDRVVHRDELIERLENGVLNQADVQDWIERLGAAGIAVAPISDFSQVWSDPQTLARDMFATLFHPVAGEVKTVGIPVKLSDTPGSLRHAAPTLAQHRQQILERFGLVDSGPR